MTTPITATLPAPAFVGGGVTAFPSLAAARTPMLDGLDDDNQRSDRMLVLSRNRTEEILISHPAGTIRVAVVDIRHGKVRLGIEAPDSVAVHRREVWESIQRETRRQEGRPQ